MTVCIRKNNRRTALKANKIIPAGKPELGKDEQVKMRIMAPKTFSLWYPYCIVKS
jgi:hypothetical protein